MTEDAAGSAPDGTRPARGPGWLRQIIQDIRLRLTLGRADWKPGTLWALDLETGGLDPRNDSILSVGMVPIRAGAIRLGEAYHSYVRPAHPVAPSSLTVHHILPRDLADAPPLRTVVREVAERLEPGVVIVHQRGMDIPFLRQAFLRCAVPLPPFLVIDTVQLLLRYARRRGHVTPERREFPTGLAPAREHFGLPAHRSHEALSDATATAELFLVLAHRLGARRLSQLL